MPKIATTLFNVGITSMKFFASSKGLLTPRFRMKAGGKRNLPTRVSCYAKTNKTNHSVTVYEGAIEREDVVYVRCGISFSPSRR